jgi:hypothetical protein
MAEEWKEVTIQRAGKTLRGKYYVFDGQITVAAWTGTKTRRLAILPAERVAQMMLRELTSEEQD